MFDPDNPFDAETGDTLALPRKRKRGDRSAEREAQNEARRDARDIAPSMGDVANPARRAAGERNLRLFCETYFPEQFALAWSDDHIAILSTLQAAALTGGLCAYAMPRGSGKTTLAECCALWVLLYAHRRFVVLIGSDKPAAEQILDSLKVELETNDALYEDFPEIIHAIRQLEGIAHRATGQLCNGERTRIGWTADEVVLPTVPGSKASGGTIRVAGITGRIRGLKAKLADGSTTRPDFVILDDPQTDESAKSVSQCAARVGVLTGAILGLAGPGKKVAGVMPCTVIQPGDMADQILDPKKHPEWNGKRTKMVYSFPSNTELWEKYSEVRVSSLKRHGDIRDATAFYAKHREEMDHGARVAWPARYVNDGTGNTELSAIQHAMNLRLRDERAFFAEYQNEPLPDAELSDEDLTADGVAQRVTGYARGEVPSAATMITAFIDVQKHGLWWLVCAWAPDCSGWVIDCGIHPEQSRAAYFTKRDQPRKLADVYPGCGMEAQIHAGLTDLTSLLLGREFTRHDGSTMRIERCMVDANWGESTDTVFDVCRASTHAAVLLPSHGKGITASMSPMAAWAKRPGERAGHNWRTTPAKRGLRAVVYDTNFWKSWTAARLLTAPGDPGAVQLWGKEPGAHAMLADHLTAEHRVRVMGKGRTVDEWKLKPNRDNEWFDALVGCAVAASVQGMAPVPPARGGEVRPGGPAAPLAKTAKKSFAQMQREARARK